MSFSYQNNLNSDYDGLGLVPEPEQNPPELTAESFNTDNLVSYPFSNQASMPEVANVMPTSTQWSPSQNENLSNLINSLPPSLEMNRDLNPPNDYQQFRSGQIDSWPFNTSWWPSASRSIDRIFDAYAPTSSFSHSERVPTLVNLNLLNREYNQNLPTEEWIRQYFPLPNENFFTNLLSQSSSQNVDNFNQVESNQLNRESYNDQNVNMGELDAQCLPPPIETLQKISFRDLLSQGSSQNVQYFNPAESNQLNREYNDQNVNRGELDAQSLLPPIETLQKISFRDLLSQSSSQNVQYFNPAENNQFNREYNDQNVNRGELDAQSLLPPIETLQKISFRDLLSQGSSQNVQYFNPAESNQLNREYNDQNVNRGELDAQSLLPPIETLQKISFRDLLSQSSSQNVQYFNPAQNNQLNREYYNDQNLNMGELNKSSDAQCLPPPNENLQNVNLTNLISQNVENIAPVQSNQLNREYNNNQNVNMEELDIKPSQSFLQNVENNRSVQSNQLNEEYNNDQNENIEELDIKPSQSFLQNIQNNLPVQSNQLNKEYNNDQNVNVEELDIKPSQSFLQSIQNNLPVQSNQLNKEYNNDQNVNMEELDIKPSQSFLQNIQNNLPVQSNQLNKEYNNDQNVKMEELDLKSSNAQCLPPSNKTLQEVDITKISSQSFSQNVQSTSHEQSYHLSKEFTTDESFDMEEFNFQPFEPKWSSTPKKKGRALFPSIPSYSGVPQNAEVLHSTDNKSLDKGSCNNENTNIEETILKLFDSQWSSSSSSTRYLSSSSFSENTGDTTPLNQQLKTECVNDQSVKMENLDLKSFDEMLLQPPNAKLQKVDVSPSQYPSFSQNDETTSPIKYTQLSSAHCNVNMEEPNLNTSGAQNLPPSNENLQNADNSNNAGVTSQQLGGSSYNDQSQYMGQLNLCPSNNQSQNVVNSYPPPQNPEATTSQLKRGKKRLLDCYIRY